jgi:hypothetical protein
VPGKKILEDGAEDRQGGPDLTKGYRARSRFVIAHNGNNEFAAYAKFTVAADKLKLD